MQEVKKNDRYDFMAKVIIIGDSGVGKTNLITCFCQNTFKDSYVATIGVDFKIKTITIGDRRYKLQIWDTAGQQRFKNITQTYYKGAAGIILTFSIVDRNSFENIERWMNQIENNAPNQVSKIIIGSKSDLETQRSVTTEQAVAVAKKYGVKYAEVSSKTGNNIRQSIQMLVYQIHRKFQKNGQVEGVSNSRREIVIADKKQADRKKCSC